jgi:hypothetical protein
MKGRQTAASFVMQRAARYFSEHFTMALHFLNIDVAFWRYKTGAKAVEEQWKSFYRTHCAMRESLADAHGNEVNSFTRRAAAHVERFFFV